MESSSSQKKMKMVQEYINTFTEKERKAYEIASSHLGSSFNIEKSIGFIKWYTKQTNHS
jgi:hypothetical protein